MAMEFNLGRVRPHYKGPYDPNANYDFYEWVTDGGSSYICINSDGTVAGNNLTDETIWAVMARGGYTASQSDLGTLTSDSEICPDSRITNLTLGENITLSFSYRSAGDFYLYIENPDRHIMQWTGVKWSGGSAPDMSEHENMLIHFVTGNGTVFYASMEGSDYNG